MSEESKRPQSKETKEELSLIGGLGTTRFLMASNLETKSLIEPESLVGDKNQNILDTSRGADNPKQIPNDQD